MVFAAALILAQATQSVTFKSEAVPLKTLFPELAKATGLPLVVSREMEWEVVYLRVKDVTPGDLMRKLAIATRGAWEKTADGRQLLKPDTALANREKDEARRELIASMTKFLREQAADPKASVDNKILGSIAQRIGIPALVGIPNGQRIVYSSAPTAMQRNLGGIDPKAISDLVLDHNKRVDRQGISEGSQIDDEDLKKYEAMLPPELVKMGKDMEEANRPKRINDTPAKINVAFGRLYEGVSVTLTMFDAKGQTLSTFSTNLGGADLADMPAMGEDEEKKPEPDKSPVIKYSDETAQMMALQGFDEEEGPVARNSSETMKKVKARILAFAQKDPFLQAHTEILNAYASHVEGNIVLSVPDSFMAYSNPKQTTVKEIEEENLGVVKGEGWVSALNGGFEGRVDREFLGSVIAMIAKKSPLGIEEKAWLSANENKLGGDYSSLTQTVFTVLGVDTYSWRNKPLLKIYGGLSTSQKQAARGPSGLGIASLPAEQRRQVESICYGANLYVKPYAVSDDNFDEELYFSMDFAKMMEREMAQIRARRDYLMEPTESMPQGVPNGAVIRIDSMSEKAFIPVSKDPNDSMAFMGDTGGASMEMLVSMMAMGEMMNIPEVANQMPTEVKHVTRETLNLTLRCTDQVGYMEKHREAKIAPDAKVTKITELGPDFDKLLAKRKEDMKRFKPMFEMGMGMGRRGSPPPAH